MAIVSLSTNHSKRQTTEGPTHGAEEWLKCVKRKKEEGEKQEGFISVFDAD